MFFFAHTTCVKEEKHMTILENWQKWTSFLGQNVARAESSGMPSKMIQQAAVQIGEYLATNVDPKNEQERVLSDLWGVASEEEKQALANCVIKLVENKPVQ
jgi:hypothetical protein